MNKSEVPFFRPSIGDEEVAAVSNCLRSGWLTTGPKTLEFEKAFSNYLGGHVTSLAVNSATAALHLALEAFGVKSGDEVILPTLTFTATAEVVRYLGATPILVDVNTDTLCVDASAVSSAITARTKAIIVVHFAGRMCNMTELRMLADKHGIKLIADAAHALPATHNGNMVGKCGADATAFSFYANKTMTTGEGGMLVSNNRELIARAKVMRLHGINRDVFNRYSDSQAGWSYDVVAPGFKYNLTDIASALGLVQLMRSDEFVDIRTKFVEIYNDSFSDLPVILPPQPAEGDKHSWHLYVLQLLPEAPVNRDDFIACMKDAGIGTSVHYRPLHRLKVWKPFSMGKEFPNADTVFGRCVSLPLFMDMSETEQLQVIKVVRSILRPCSVRS